MTPKWRLEELAERVSAALSLAAYEGQSSGRVRSVPDARTIRYYTTLGILDRPLEMRGRTAYYGERHLLQLIAIKRLQARGWSLVEIQTALAAADTSTISGYADVPAEILGQLKSEQLLGSKATAERSGSPLEESPPDWTFSEPVAESTQPGNVFEKSNSHFRGAGGADEIASRNAEIPLSGHAEPARFEGVVDLETPSKSARPEFAASERKLFWATVPQRTREPQVVPLPSPVRAVSASIVHLAPGVSLVIEGIASNEINSLDLNQLHHAAAPLLDVLKSAGMPTSVASSQHESTNTSPEGELHGLQRRST